MKKHTAKLLYEVKKLFLFFEETSPSLYLNFKDCNTAFISWLEKIPLDETHDFNSSFYSGNITLSADKIEKQIFVSLIKDRLNYFFCFLKENNDRDIDKKKVLEIEENIDLSMLII